MINTIFIINLLTMFNVFIIDVQARSSQSWEELARNIIISIMSLLCEGLACFESVALRTLLICQNFGRTSVVRDMLRWVPERGADGIPLDLCRSPEPGVWTSAGALGFGTPACARTDASAPTGS